jgi:hypothetical protein
MCSELIVYAKGQSQALRRFAMLDRPEFQTELVRIGLEGRADKSTDFIFRNYTTTRRPARGSATWHL